MIAASEPIAGADTPLNIVLGAGVLLLFAGILIRALARHQRARTRTSPLRALTSNHPPHRRAPARRAPQWPESTMCQRATRSDERAHAAAL